MKPAHRQQSDTRGAWLQSSEDSTPQKEPGEDTVSQVPPEEG